MKKQIICPYCKNKNIVKRGSFKTKAHGKQQRYFCKSCNKKFIEKNGFFRMRNTPQKITCALDLFFRGLSTRGVQRHFQAFFPHNSDHTSILRWLWINKNDKERIPKLTELDKARFEEGYVIEEYAKQLFPDLIDLSKFKFDEQVEKLQSI